MDNIMPMGTTDRHNELINSFIADIFSLVRKKEVRALQSDCALVHYGEKNKNDLIRLVDINDIDNREKFIETTIYELDYVQPDFFFFKDNPYLRNERGTRTAGYPDLVVEVWSDSNDNLHRMQKTELYSSSPLTEHWYIEQDSNVVECYLGKTKLFNQYLTEILETQKGLKFDLRYLTL